MSVRMRINRAATGRRRSGHGLEEPRVSKCSNCGEQHLRHKMCSSCGHYRGRLVIDIAAKVEKKASKLKAKQQEIGTDTGEDKTQEVKDDKKPHTSDLSPEELSKHKSN